MSRLDKLKELEEELHRQMQKANSRTIAAIARQYRETLKEIEEIEGVGGNEDEIESITLDEINVEEASEEATINTQIPTTFAHSDVVEDITFVEMQIDDNITDEELRVSMHTETFERVTEEGDERITENADVRYTEEE